ncbi:MAG TPA: ABC transporter substrate-binding protein, partial [Candidatus Latescibacteria bacterium]|nr:ABC transporter substrate-binding protein [Candidatus Latescibacterota bacterium]
LERLDFEFNLPGWRGLPAYENNEFDRIGISGPDLQRAKIDPVLSQELITFPNFGTYYTIFQTTRPPFNNIKLRQAIAHAIDRESICNIVLGGAATPAYGMLPKGFPGYQVDR